MLVLIFSRKISAQDGVVDEGDDIVDTVCRKITAEINLEVRGVSALHEKEVYVGVTFDWSGLVFRYFKVKIVPDESDILESVFGKFL